MSQSLARRTADFLKQHPPFAYLSDQTLLDFSASIRVRYVGKQEFIFEKGNPGENHVYCLQKGQVDILNPELEGEQGLLDRCDQGDLFGVRAMLNQVPYIASAQAREECLIYVIPRDAFLAVAEQEPKVLMYLASGFAAGMTVVREKASEFHQMQRSQTHGSQSQMIFKEEDIVAMKAVDEVAFCLEGNTVKEAAQIMAEYRIGSLVVADHNLYPIGIVTSTDYTRRVGTGKVAIEAPVRHLMSSPVVTIPTNFTVSQVMLKMMRHGIRHLVATEDGSANSRFVGLISEHDLLVRGGNNPAVLVKRISKAKGLAELVEVRDRAEELIYHFLNQEISISFITDTMTEINDALITRCLQLAQAEMVQRGLGPPPVAFAWLNLGSEGRREQLLRTDQDNALIFEDPSPSKLAEVRSYFLELSGLVVDFLNQCGFALCPGEIMASNPRWNLSVSEWKRQFAEWIETPAPKALMHSTIFFDFRAGYGDAALTQELEGFLHQEIEEHPGFLNFLAQNALGNPPPLSFFKGFMVERSGQHKDDFDIKLRGMMPLCDAARVLSLQHQLTQVNNTPARFRQLAELEPANAGVYQEAAMAYELMIRYRSLNGLRDGNSGRYLNPQQLNKIERQTLKSSFRNIEEIQSLLKTRFSLGVFGV
ncbi:MAG: DUF294 nucleotidyltransferase-like domain-containing protein [Bacteroidota bacterium]